MTYRELEEYVRRVLTNVGAERSQTLMMRMIRNFEKHVRKSERETIKGDLRAALEEYDLLDDQKEK